MITIYCDGATDRVCWVRDTGVSQTSHITYAKEYANAEKTTSNEGEWHSLIVALEDAIRDGYKTAIIFMDSQLVVNQLTGHYKVKAENLKPLYARVQELLSGKIVALVTWLPREDNRAGLLLERRAWKDEKAG